MATLTPIITGTPGNPPSYNVGMAETFSWIPVENDANRPLFARAGYITNLKDLSISLSASDINIGAVELTDGANHSIRATIVQLGGTEGNALKVLTQDLQSTNDSVTIGDKTGSFAAVNKSLSALRVFEVAPVTAVNILNTAAVSGSITITNPTTAVNISNVVAVSGSITVSNLISSVSITNPVTQLSATILNPSFTVLNPVSSVSLTNQLSSFSVTNPTTAVNVLNTVAVSGAVTILNPVSSVSLTNQLTGITVLNPVTAVSLINQLSSLSITNPTTAVNISNTVAVSGSITVTNPTTGVNVLNPVALKDLNNNNVTVTPATSSLNVNVTNPIVATVDPSVGFPISFARTPNFDAFGRLRTSSPLTLFDSSHRYNDNNLWSSLTAVGGSTSFNQNQGLIDMTVSNLSGSSVIRETTKVFSYQAGKALRNGEPVLTPSGWVNIENLSVGDKVFDGLGNITEVTGVYPQGKRKIYRFAFDDGSFVDADEEHLWVTIIREGGKKGKKGSKRIITTKQMLEEQGNIPVIRLRWRIPCSPVLKIEETPVDLDPYTLGVILGDGHINKGGSVIFTTADTEMLNYVVCKKITKKAGKYNYGLHGLSEATRKYNLNGKIFNTKFIPDEYKYNSERVRLEVLKGLMDTDGWIEKNKCTYYATGSMQLAEDICFLVRSLGGTAKIKTRKCPFYRTKAGVKIYCNPSYTVVVILPINPFRLKRKADQWQSKWRTSFDRYVHSIQEVGEDEATCIRVASDEHTFLTRNHIVTHNSLQVMNTFVMAPSATNLRQRVGYFGQDNGIYIQLDDSTISFVERSLVNGSPSSETIVPLSAWNGDKLDGNGPSGLTLDITKAQIFWMDIEWLGVGTVRCGLVINGQFVVCHSFHHANLIASTYITTASLPLRYEITNKGATSGSHTLKQVCSTVISEGGYELRGLQQAVGTSILSPKALATAGTLYPVATIRLKSSPNRLDAIVILTAISLMGTGTGIYNWQVIASGTTSGGSGTWVSAGDNSSVQYKLDATSISGGRILASGFFTSNTQGATTIDILKEALFKFQLERNSLTSTPYELILAVTASTNTELVYGSLDWEEVSR